MAALASLTGVTGNGPVESPQRPQPVIAVAPPSTGGAAFTAFPPSYGAFGNSDAGFGTIGVKNGTLTVVPPGDPASAPVKAAAGDPSQSKSDPAKNGTPVPGDPPPVATLPPQAPPKVYGLHAPEIDAPQASNDLPGPFSTANQQNPAPDPQAHAQELRAAAQQAAAQAQADADASARATLTFSLQNVTFHIAAANGTGNTAAAAQLGRTAVQINGSLKNQVWAGIGTPPPPAFAKPEIPTVFLNFPA